MSDAMDRQQATVPQPASTAATSEAVMVSSGSGSGTGLMKRLLKRCKGGQKEAPEQRQQQQPQGQLDDQQFTQQQQQPPQQQRQQQQQQQQLSDDPQPDDSEAADTTAVGEQTTTAGGTTAATTVEGGVGTAESAGAVAAAADAVEVTASGGSTTSNNHGMQLLPRLRRSGSGNNQRGNSTGETAITADQDQLGAATAATHNTGAADTAGEDDGTGAANQAGEDEPMTESKATADDTGASQSQQQEGQKQRTRSQIFRSNELAARKKAEQFWTVDNEEYNFKSALHHYTNVDKHVKPKDMKYIVDHREKQMCDDYGKVMRTVIRGAIHPLVDNVVTGFCQRMGMSETQKVPTVEERMFLWFHRERALKLLPRMGPKKQVYFVNFINWDHVLTDLQSLNSRLRHCALTEGQTFAEHYCHDPLKIREVFTTKFSAKEGTPMPKMLFVDKQTICPHIFESQEFNTACQEKECPNYGRRMCRCFQMNVFIPETLVLATKREFERVLKNFIDDKYFSQRWMIRASNLKSGNGIQFIDSASELETFLRYDIRRRLRGQFFIMQRYLKNPMLLGLRRFDCRMFLMICVLTDRRVLGFLHPGYVREAQKDFDPASNDLRCHITLPFTWDPDYNRYKGANPEQLPDYCHPYTKVCGELELPQLDFRTFDGDLRSENYFIGKVNCMAQEIVRSMESIIFDKPGTWQLFGLDIAVDNEKNPWLYDVITYPCIGEPDFFSETQNRMVPAILTEALTIVFELNQRDFATRSRLEWMDLPDIPWNKPGLITAQQNFIWMYSTSPERLLSYKEEYKIPRLHWYHQWRVTEDFNDYILYLKNFRIDSIVRTQDSNIYGRKTFDHSPVFKLKQQLKKSGFRPQ